MPAQPVLLECTVVTGFEAVAAEETVEKLGQHLLDKPRCLRGRILFSLASTEQLTEVFSLRSLNRIFVVVLEKTDVGLCGESLNDCRAVFQRLVDDVDWTNGLLAWFFINDNKTALAGQLMAEHPEIITDNFADSLASTTTAATTEATITATTMKFRVTCNRSGNNHSFTSQEAAANFGGYVQEFWKWTVNLSEFDLEIVLYIEGDNVRVCFSLTEESLHRRNITQFGRTTLNPVIGHCMLRLCDIRPGEVVCDPMCGVGGIPLECAIEWPDCVNICGDIEEIDCRKTSDNLLSLNLTDGAKSSFQVVNWDCTELPLRSESIDVVVSDFPFGKRVGKRTQNWTLYANSLVELARCVRPTSGRACILSADRKCMISTVKKPAISQYWRNYRTFAINIGGLNAFVFLFRRTGKRFVQSCCD